MRQCLDPAAMHDHPARHGTDIGAVQVAHLVRQRSRRPHDQQVGPGAVAQRIGSTGQLAGAIDIAQRHPAAGERVVHLGPHRRAPAHHQHPTDAGRGAGRGHAAQRPRVVGAGADGAVGLIGFQARAAILGSHADARRIRAVPDHRQRQRIPGAVHLLVDHPHLAGAGQTGLLEHGAGRGGTGGRHEAFALEEVGDGGVGHGRRSVAVAHRPVKSGTQLAQLTRG